MLTPHIDVSAAWWFVLLTIISAGIRFLARSLPTMIDIAIRGPFFLSEFVEAAIDFVGFAIAAIVIWCMIVGTLTLVAA